MRRILVALAVVLVAFGGAAWLRVREGVLRERREQSQAAVLPERAALRQQQHPASGVDVDTPRGDGSREDGAGDVVEAPVVSTSDSASRSPPPPPPPTNSATPRPSVAASPTPTGSTRAVSNGGRGDDEVPSGGDGGGGEIAPLSGDDNNSVGCDTHAAIRQWLTATLWAHAANLSAFGDGGAAAQALPPPPAPCVPQLPAQQQLALIGVPADPASAETRARVRDTWATWLPDDMHLVFVVSAQGVRGLQAGARAALAAEAAVHGDVLAVDVCPEGSNSKTFCHLTTVSRGALRGVFAFHVKADTDAFVLPREYRAVLRAVQARTLPTIADEVATWPRLPPMGADGNPGPQPSPIPGPLLAPRPSGTVWTPEAGPMVFGGLQFSKGVFRWSAGLAFFQGGCYFVSAALAAALERDAPNKRYDGYMEDQHLATWVYEAHARGPAGPAPKVELARLNRVQTFTLPHTRGGQSLLMCVAAHAANASVACAPPPLVAMHDVKDATAYRNLFTYYDDAYRGAAGGGSGGSSDERPLLPPVPAVDGVAALARRPLVGREEMADYMPNFHPWDGRPFFPEA